MSVPVGRPGKTSRGGCLVDPEGQRGLPGLPESLPGGKALIPLPLHPHGQQPLAGAWRSVSACWKTGVQPWGLSREVQLGQVMGSPVQ